MMKKVSVNSRGDTLLPDYLIPAHDLCFLNHDVLVELLRSGEESGIFEQRFEFKNEEEKMQLENSADIFEWLALTKRTDERTRLLKKVVFPALLSDFLHFIYEGLESSRKAKLNVTYALIRKPIQENLFLFEVIAADPEKFSNLLIENPLRLRAKHAGGIEAHTKRVNATLETINETQRFDAEYISRLRYSKEEDGFDGICNHAIHLFTEHEAIRTEPMNINFIFSGDEEKQTQWYYLYSRLPYLLFYSRRLIEYICATFAKTEPKYLLNIERRVSAATLLWEPNIEQTYQHPLIDHFVETTRNMIDAEFLGKGLPAPTIKDLKLMARTGELTTTE